MNDYLIKNAVIVNEGGSHIADVLIEGERIKNIFRKNNFTDSSPLSSRNTINAEGKYLFPGVIDCHVHFREPGLTEKGDIYTESKAAVSGGITSYLEMPNTIPFADSIKSVEEKNKIASVKSIANYSFFLGATGENINEIKKINPKNICGLKLFMGCSTGNILIDDKKTLNEIFTESPVLIAVHCEDEKTINENLNIFRKEYGEDIPPKYHAEIRSAEACYKSTSLAIELAEKHNTRLHITHVSTAKELSLLKNNISLPQKKITSEVSVHHLWFDDSDYKKSGNLIKCNPSIKTLNDKEALLENLINNKIDIIATDHAPHTLAEKQNKYLKSPSGIPMVQHSLTAMLELNHKNKISLEKIAEKMCHSPAECYKIKDRGYIRENYYADLVIVDLNCPWKIDKSNMLSKCKWSPFENATFNSKVLYTFVNGNLAFNNNNFNEEAKGKILEFNR
ncbi:MAG: dihydroorotase [Bacteroidales bacterium]|nr:dihydroorotase [Bacteroidales bacterium]